KIGYVGDKDVIFFFDEPACLHILLTVIPVHIGIDGLSFKWKNVKRDNRITAGCVFAGNIHVSIRCKGVVWPTQNRYYRPFGLTGISNSLFAQFGKPGIAL